MFPAKSADYIPFYKMRIKCLLQTPHWFDKYVQSSFALFSLCKDNISVFQIKPTFSFNTDYQTFHKSHFPPPYYGFLALISLTIYLCHSLEEEEKENIFSVNDPANGRHWISRRCYCRCHHHHHPHTHTRSEQLAFCWYPFWPALHWVWKLFLLLKFKIIFYCSWK